MTFSLEIIGIAAISSPDMEIFKLYGAEGVTIDPAHPAGQKPGLPAPADPRSRPSYPHR